MAEHTETTRQTSGGELPVRPTLTFGGRWPYAPAPEAADVARIAPRYELFVGGEWVEPAAGGEPGEHPVAGDRPGVGGDDRGPVLEEERDAVEAERQAALAGLEHQPALAGPGAGEDLDRDVTGQARLAVEPDFVRWLLATCGPARGEQPEQGLGDLVEVEPGGNRPDERRLAAGATDVVATAEPRELVQRQAGEQAPGRFKLDTPHRPSIGRARARSRWTGRP